ncbi:MltA domain-containing protein [Aquabacterium sp. J223]|nr:MltA domain-containing protein [Aquabacterium sp. J223]UUX96346.1 MltA domain-containing protein [Aquabacterium sp. J223]
MVRTVVARRDGAGPSGPAILGSGHRRRRAWGWVATLAALLTACGTAPPPPAPAPEAPASVPPVATAPAAPVPGTLQRSRSRWVPVAFDELPGWRDDRLADWWVAFRRGCERPAPGFAGLCAEAAGAPSADDGFLRLWLEQRLQPYRLEAMDGSAATGLLTGYFEPLVEAVRSPRPTHAVPLLMPPADLASRRPYWTRQQLDSLPAAQAGSRGREIAWVADPLDALVLQIQGSGRLKLTEPDGRQQTVRVAYAGHNDQPYKSVGRWLIDQGELKAEQASWPAIRDWARRNPKRVQEMLWANPRVVFFREEPLPDPGIGPRGAQGVPLTPGRSIAVDPQSVPYGTPVWVDATEPLSATPLRRLVMAQDTGSAIVGAVRADFFWGWGDEAEAKAGRTKQPLRMWALWPR